MSGVIIEISGDLPERIPLTAEFGPGFIHIIMREGLSQAETVEALQDAWQTIREHYGINRIKMLESA